MKRDTHQGDIELNLKSIKNINVQTWLNKIKGWKYVWFLGAMGGAIMGVALMQADQWKNQIQEALIEPELKPYVERYLTEKAAPLNFLIRVRWGQFTDRLGECQREDSWSLRTITMDRVRWMQQTEAQRTWLMFHELGHCDLNLKHESVDQNKIMDRFVPVKQNINEAAWDRVLSHFFGGPTHGVLTQKAMALQKQQQETQHLAQVREMFSLVWISLPLENVAPSIEEDAMPKAGRQAQEEHLSLIMDVDGVSMDKKKNNKK